MTNHPGRAMRVPHPWSANSAHLRRRARQSGSHPTTTTLAFPRYQDALADRAPHGCQHTTTRAGPHASAHMHDRNDPIAATLLIVALPILSCC